MARNARLSRLPADSASARPVHPALDLQSLDTQSLDIRRRYLAFVPGVRCRSSVVEHSIGNGEVDSSILSGSTSHLLTIDNLR